MFGSSQGGANAYAKVGIETGVVAASPHTLIVMLFEGAMAAVTSALQHMKAGDIEHRGLAISKAIMIIDNGLRASLNKTAGGGIASNLDALYEYMSKRLIVANLKSDAVALDEVHQLLKDLKEAWEAIKTSATVTPITIEPPAPTAYDNLAPHTSRLVKA